MHEKLKAAFSRMGVLAAAYLPPGFKDSMLDMALEIDRSRSDIDRLTAELNALKETK